MERPPAASEGPRFRPEAPTGPARRMLPVVIVAALTVGAAVMVGWPASGMSLRCHEGRLHAEATGFLGRSDDLASLPPLPTSAGRCTDQRFGSRAELETRWIELALIAVDDALITDDDDRLEEVGPILDAVAGLESEAGPDRVESRRRALLVARLRADVNAARGSRLRARARLQEARDAGVDPELLSELERALESGPPPQPPVPRAEQPGAPPPAGPGSSPQGPAERPL